MGREKKGQGSRWRKTARRIAVAGLLIVILLSAIGDWFVHHPRKWLLARIEAYPRMVTAPLFWFGNPTADITDSLDLTGHDAVYEYDEEAPCGTVTFAGIPRRVADPAPEDIVVIDKGEFKIGWSASLRHPAWVAYHVVRDAKFEDSGKRPSFLVDKKVPRTPKPDDYTRTGYDRGHMAPNHAILSRYGIAEQRKTFMMSNIAPQSAALNRGVWRDLEHRIAEFWTARYGEIWVVVGSIPSGTRATLNSIDVDVPDSFFQVVMAQEGLDIRALAVLIPQDVGWNAWGARYILTIDELEQLTGYDFNPELPGFIQDPLEADLPSRLWPIRFQDIFRQIMLRFN